MYILLFINLYLSEILHVGLIVFLQIWVLLHCWHFSPKVVKEENLLNVWELKDKVFVSVLLEGNRGYPEISSSIRSSRGSRSICSRTSCGSFIVTQLMADEFCLYFLLCCVKWLNKSIESHSMCSLTSSGGLVNIKHYQLYVELTFFLDF